MACCPPGVCRGTNPNCEGYYVKGGAGYRGGGGCLTYIFTGRAGNCIMLPVWRAIAQFLGII